MYKLHMFNAKKNKKTQNNKTTEKRHIRYVTFFAASRNEVESECEHAESASESCTRMKTNSKDHDNNHSNENDYDNNWCYNAGTSKSDESN